MRIHKPLKNEVRRIVCGGALLMIAGYLLDSFIHAALKGGSFYRETVFPDAGELAARLGSFSILLLLVSYASKLFDERKTLEKALVKYQAAIDASIDGIFFLNARQECIYLNSSHLRLHCYQSHREILGKSWRLFYEESEAERFEKEVFPVLFGAGEWRGEAVGRKSDGSRFPQEISFTVMDGGSLVCIVRDISVHKEFQCELERKAEELAEANSELEAFGYSLTHDMRNYLTRMQLAEQILLDDYSAVLDENAQQLLKALCSTNDEAEILINEILVLSRTIRAEISRELVNLSELAREILLVLALTEPERNVDVHITPGLTAVCDGKLLKLALDNLLSNAWKYTAMTQEPVISFGSTICNGTPAFFIRDNGIGFDMAEAEMLFKPFQRLCTASDFPGNGIGLSTVQRIIRRHCGEVWGEGEPGKGAVFFFTLPEQDAI